MNQKLKILYKLYSPRLNQTNLFFSVLIAEQLQDGKEKEWLEKAFTNTDLKELIMKKSKIQKFKGN